jgi:solute carrier family 10 (sodium/bile acid cotransporter), member 7
MDSIMLTPLHHADATVLPLVHSGAREDLVHQRFVNVVLIVVASAVVHIIYLAFNTAAVLALRLPVREGIAVLIMASQKSAPVAVTVIT